MRPLKSLLLSMALCVFPLQALAEELVFSVIDDVPSTRLAKQILSRAYTDQSISIRPLVVPSRRALLIANQGSVDGDLFRIAGIEQSHPNLIRVPYPLLEGHLHLATADPTITDWTPETLQTWTIAIRRGVIIAERATAGMNTLVADSYDQMAELMKHGRVDVALVSDIEGRSPMTSKTWVQIKILHRPVVHFRLYHYLHKKHAARVQPLAESLRRMTDSGETAHILEDSEISERTRAAHQ